MDKEQKKLLKEVRTLYNDDGTFTEKGEARMRELHKKSADFEVELCNLVNKHARTIPPEMFGAIWDRTTKSIMAMHQGIQQQVSMPAPPNGGMEVS